MAMQKVEKRFGNFEAGGPLDHFGTSGYRNNLGRFLRRWPLVFVLPWAFLAGPFCYTEDRTLKIRQTGQPSQERQTGIWLFFERRLDRWQPSHGQHTVHKADHYHKSSEFVGSEYRLLWPFFFLVYRCVAKTVSGKRI